MDIYAQPSLNEGMGKALLMAQAAGLPAVASRVCGIPDVVEEGRSALLVMPGRSKELAAALRPNGTGSHFARSRMAGSLEAVYVSLSAKKV